MPRPSQYTEAQKTAILDAVKAGRKAGKTWPDILEATKAAGYKGSLPYLMKLAHSAGAVRRRRRRVINTDTSVKRGPGRPKGSGKRGPGTVKSASSNGVGLGAIDSIVKRMVEERVSATLARAIATLERATAELKSR